MGYGGAGPPGGHLWKTRIGSRGEVSAVEAINTGLRALDHIPWALVLKVDVIEPRGCEKECRRSLRW